MNKLKLPPYDPDEVIMLYQLMGSSLFMIQSLELVLSHYLVFAHKIKPELAVQEIKELFNRTEAKTFGGLFNELRSDPMISEEIKTRLKCLVDERNWLVHKLYVNDQKNMFSKAKSSKLLFRVQRIGDEACELRKIINDITNQILRERNHRSEDDMNKEIQKILDSWSL